MGFAEWKSKWSGHAVSLKTNLVCACEKGQLRLRKYRKKAYRGDRVNNIGH